MITFETLKNKKACNSQIEIFKKHFPKSAPLTVKAAVSVSTLFDWNWASQNLLSIHSRDAYYAATKSASDAYYAATKSASDAYDAAMKSASDAYYAAVESASDAYCASKPASDAYCASKARAFAEIYISENT